METLWAPWRISYIEAPKINDCIFCSKPTENRDRENFIIYRGQFSFVIMNFYPYNNGHLMVVPYKHTSDIEDLSEKEKLEIMDLLVICKKALSVVMSPHGYNIGMNLGEVAGAGIRDHLHFHIVPRWNGDTNFMPVTGHTKVVSEGLSQTWDKLKKEFDRLVS